MIYHNPPAVVQGRALGGVCNRAVGPAELSLSPLPYVHALETLLRRLKNEKASPAERGIPFAGRLLAKVSTYADDITVFVSHRLDIKAMKKAVAGYEQGAWAKINFDKGEGLRLEGGVSMLGPFRILGVWFGPGIQLERNWSEVQAKVDAHVGTWL